MSAIKPLTDFGNAERFVDQHNNDVKYCPQTKTWLIWKGDRWEADEVSSALMKKAIDTVRRIPSEVDDFNLDKENISKVDLEKHAKKSESEGKLRSMLRLAQKFPEIQVTVEKLDSDPMVLNCTNGTIDLKTGMLQEHARKDLITKSTHIVCDPAADCPTWLTFINKIFSEKPKLISYLQRIIGYALSGMTIEQCLFILYGRGSNGKSTLLETVRLMLGDYSRHADADTFLQSGYGRIRNDIARLCGARFLTSVEVGIGKKLDEATIKALTGGDAITSRFLYKEHFEYTPNFKLFLATNYKPEIIGTDKGIWRRIHLVLCDACIEEGEMDKNLPQKLAKELPGILNWAIQGCLDWQKSGLSAPKEVKDATRIYREETDVVGNFIADKCTVDSKSTEPLKNLYDEFAEWADNCCEEKFSKKNFGSFMKRRGYAQSKSGSVRFWNGIKVNDNTPSSKKENETKRVGSNSTEGTHTVKEAVQTELIITDADIVN